MTDMPSTYDTQQTTTTTTSTGPRLSLQKDYVKTVSGILKIVEIVLSLIVFICACSAIASGLGWVRFVSISAFVTTLVYFILYLVNAVSYVHRAMSNNVSLFHLVEFIYYCIFTLFFLIAAIVAATYANSGIAAIAACTFFAFAATAVYAVDTFFQFRAWRSGQAEMGTHSSATTTTTTRTTHVEQTVTY